TEDDFVRTPSSFDRSKQPISTSDPYVILPQITSFYLQNRLKVLSTEQKELPLIKFNLFLSGGMLRDPEGKEGTANLLAQLLNEGTAFKNSEEFEESLLSLGAEIKV